MAKMKKKEPQTLAELMQDTVVEDLLLNAEVLGFHDVGVMDRMKPYQMKQYLAKQILQNPVQVLNRMSVEDLVLMQQLVDECRLFYERCRASLCDAWSDRLPQ